MTDKFITPLLDPWVKELQDKEDQRRGTRRHASRIEVVMDGAAAHKSKFTQRTMDVLDIYRIAWAAQSPDLNPIEHCWDYIRSEFRRKKVRLNTEAEIIKAWEDEWALIPVEKINQWIEDLEKRLKQVIEHGGDNCFHG